MMKGLDSGKDKIQKICDVLRKETLDPARQEAKEIVENAHLQADVILKEAQQAAEKILQGAEKEREEKQKLLQASLQFACRQTIDSLKQKIEKELFNAQLQELVVKEMTDPKVMAHLIQALIRAVEEKGWVDEFQVLIPKGISPTTINALLAQHILDKLEKHSVSVSDFSGGVQIRLKNRKMTLDASDSVVREWMGQYIRADFRKLLFSV